MANWTLEDINWSSFDATKVTPELLPLIQTAALVEYNGKDYARYLCEVFAGDAEAETMIRKWADEEVQHGAALAKWAEMANPDYHFGESFAVFTTGYQLPQHVSASVRGSQAGEMLARCVVEAGTSSYYTAISEYTDEPVLKQICKKIAADEFRHYKLFYDYFQHYVKKDSIGMVKRLQIVIGRVMESEDDELAYAFYAACHHKKGETYNRKTCTQDYMFHAFRIYRKMHIQKMTSMIFKAVGLTPHSRLNQWVAVILWQSLQWKSRRVKKA